MGQNEKEAVKQDQSRSVTRSALRGGCAFTTVFKPTFPVTQVQKLRGIVQAKVYGFSQKSKIYSPLPFLGSIPASVDHSFDRFAWTAAKIQRACFATLARSFTEPLVLIQKQSFWTRNNPSEY